MNSTAWVAFKTDYEQPVTNFSKCSVLRTLVVTKTWIRVEIAEAASKQITVQSNCQKKSLLWRLIWEVIAHTGALGVIYMNIVLS